MGGAFTTLGGQPRSRIARLHPDGTPDTSFNPGANDTVLSLAVQPDGKILVCGNFTTLAGKTQRRIGRLNADGALDTSFNPGANDGVYRPRRNPALDQELPQTRLTRGRSSGSPDGSRHDESPVTGLLN